MYRIHRDTELAWAAGFFEGDGTVTAARDQRRLRIRVGLQQHADEDQAVSRLQRFANAVGVGKVLGPYDYRGRYSGPANQTKLRYVLAYQSAGSAEQVMEALDPYITPGASVREKYRALVAERDEFVA